MFRGTTTAVADSRAQFFESDMKFLEARAHARVNTFAKSASLSWEINSTWIITGKEIELETNNNKISSFVRWMYNNPVFDEYLVICQFERFSHNFMQNIETMSASSNWKISLKQFWYQELF